MKSPVCVDCITQGIPYYRPTPYGGPRTPRCDTHHRQERRRKSAAQHGRTIQRKYGITDQQYKQLLDHQGGTCAICQVANGKTKRLAVDHDHRTGQVRGILCGPCNKDVIGRLTLAALYRAIDYRLNPPAQILDPS